MLAVASALGVAGWYLTHIRVSATSGWIGYAPLTGSIRWPTREISLWLRSTIWIALIAVWAGLALLVWQPRRPAPRLSTHPDDAGL